MRSAFSLMLLLALAAAAGCRKAPPPEPQANQTQAAAPSAPEQPTQLLDRSQARKPAPTARFLKADGSKISLADFRGKPVLLNLWATWCVPCITEMPQLDTLAGQQEGLQVITVSQDGDEDGMKKAEDFFARKKFKNLKLYLDPDMALMDVFSAQSLPTTVLFDKDGKEVWRVIGPEEWTGKKAAGLIAEAG
jgi:thiol-disulfide isomerase/thioredoxin